jgi:hypothetical protein
MLVHRRLAALALMAMVLPASGCGGGGKSATTTTRTELIAKADAICGRLNARLASSPIKSVADFARIVPRLAAYERAAFAELGRLLPPASMASDWRQIVAGGQTIASYTAKLGEYAKANNLKGAGPLYPASRKVQQKTLAIAKRDGFKDCAEGV